MRDDTLRCLKRALQKSIALPDMHSGYGFAIGNVAAFDMGNPEAVVSPGGVGFDINCGVRLIRTNLVGILRAVRNRILKAHASAATTSGHVCGDVHSLACQIAMPVLRHVCSVVMRPEMTAKIPGSDVTTTWLPKHENRRRNGVVVADLRRLCGAPEAFLHVVQTEADVQDRKEELAQSLFDHIPVGVGSQGIIPTTAADLEASLEMGMDWSLREVPL